MIIDQNCVRVCVCEVIDPYFFKIFDCCLTKFLVLFSSSLSFFILFLDIRWQSWRMYDSIICILVLVVIDMTPFLLSSFSSFALDYIHLSSFLCLSLFYGRFAYRVLCCFFSVFKPAFKEPCASSVFAHLVLVLALTLTTTYLPTHRCLSFIDVSTQSYILLFLSLHLSMCFC